MAAPKKECKSHKLDTDIAKRTEFNTQNILEGSFTDKVVEIGSNKIKHHK